MKKIIFTLTLGLLVAAQAEKAPTPVKNGDSRLREIIYNPNEVVRIKTYYGISTAIIFHPDETVLMAGVGDKEAWEIEQSKNLVLLRPVATMPYTNLTIQTNLHLYHFILDVLEDEKNINQAPFRVSFKYPTYEANKRAKAAAKKKQAANKKYVARKKAKANAPLRAFDPSLHYGKHKESANVNYFYQGDNAIKPSFVYDDGTHTYLHFLHSQPNPSIYSLIDDGKESLVNRNSAGDWVIVQGIYKELRLRVGDTVLAILNDNYNPLLPIEPVSKSKNKRFIKSQAEN